MLGADPAGGKPGGAVGLEGGLFMRPPAERVEIEHVAQRDSLVVGEQRPHAREPGATSSSGGKRGAAGRKSAAGLGHLVSFRVAVRASATVAHGERRRKSTPHVQLSLCVRTPSGT